MAQNNTFFNIESFCQNLNEEFEEAIRLKDEIQSIELDELYYPDLLEDKGKITKEIQLAETLEKIRTYLYFAFEQLNLNFILAKFEEEFASSLKEHEIINRHKLMPYYEGFYVDFPFYILLRKYFDAIMALKSNRLNTNHSVDVLERLLRSTPFFIEKFKLDHKREDDIKNMMLEIIQVIYPDASRETLIVKADHSSKIDIVVSSIKTIIEFKYINKEKNSKKNPQSLFEDFALYEHNDFENYFAVICQTEHFIPNEETIKSQFKILGMPENWKIILVLTPVLFPKSEEATLTEEQTDNKTP